MTEQRGAQFYGSVTVSDRGQIVIPAQARRDLGIEVGEKLLVISGPGEGLIFIRAGMVHQMLARWTKLARRMVAEATTGTDFEEGAENTNEET